MTSHRTTDPWVDEAMLIEIVMPSGARHPLTADPDSSLNRYGPEGRLSPALFDEGGDVFDALSLAGLGLQGGHIEAEHPERVKEWLMLCHITPDNPVLPVEGKGLMSLVRPLRT